MNRNKRGAAWGIIVALLGCFVILYISEGGRFLATASPQDGHFERSEGYYTVVDDTGRTIFTTGHMVFAGDKFISEDDTEYEVIKVEKDVATAKAIGKLQALPPVPILGAQAPKSTSVAIYHTHSDESYIPDDGSDSIPAKGGVLRVGEAMARTLDRLGIKGVNDNTSHDPHDAQAYDRSRRTAQRLLRDLKPSAIFDVHRDAGPKEPYLKTVDGKEVTKGMIVIGRQNPKMSSNLEFARRLKDAVNSKYPGLVKGIFLGKADFNQDLSSRSLLLEMGTEKTSRSQAEAGVSLIANVVPSVLGAVGPGITGPENRGAGRAIGWILGILVAGIFIYLWVSTGSWDEMKAKILGWFGSGGVKIGGGRNDHGSEEGSGDEPGKSD